MSFDYSFEVFELDEALTPYGTIETKPPTSSEITISDFRDGIHFRTGPEEISNSLILQLEDRILMVVLDESGSMTWNDHFGDRFIYLKRLLEILDNTYPGSLSANLIGFGGSLTKTKLFVAKSSENLLSQDRTKFSSLLQNSFQDSVFDFAGVRVVRRTDRFPNHPADGIAVAEGIIDAVKDENLTEGQLYYYGLWTFNKDGVFSNGQYIKAKPADRILPKGINFASGISQILPGAKRDINTQLILNLVEKSGLVVFDSSGNGRHGSIGNQVIEDIFWSGDSTTNSFINGSPKKSCGVRFDGSFDIIEVEYDSHSFDFIGSEAGEPYTQINLSPQSLTWNFWIFSYPITQTAWIIGTSTQLPTDDIGLAVGISASGTIVYSTTSIAFGFEQSTGITISPYTWTMVTFVISDNSLRVYTNGALSFTDTSDWQTRALVGESIGPGININRLYIGAKPVDEGTQSQSYVRDYFGVLGQISVHNTARSDQYISDLYTQEYKIFNQSLSESQQDPPDNTQREVMLSWSVESDFNYAGGKVRILRRYRTVPSHDDDGDIVTEQPATVGQFFFVDTYDFINNEDYYYRIFTYSSVGTPCDRADARIINVHIQESPTITISTSDVVTQESIIVGDKKLFLQWSNPGTSTWRGTKIYFSTDNFPTITTSTSGTIQVSNGSELADTTLGYFTHRLQGKTESNTDIPLENGITHYYTIFTYDRLGNLSEPRYLTGVPSSQSTIVFPPPDVTDVHIDVLNPKTLSVQWENPTLRTEDLILYFGEIALVFVSVKDIFGGNLDDVTNLKLKFCATAKRRPLKTNEKILGNETGQGSTNPHCRGVQVGSMNRQCQFAFKPKDCTDNPDNQEISLSYATVESGLIKGLLTHTADPQILSRRTEYIVDVWSQYRVIDQESGLSVFEFNTKPSRVIFKHPIKISLVNLRHKKISVGCEQQGGIRGRSLCDCDSETQSDNCVATLFNGGYTGATQPYICRVEIQFKGESMPDGAPVNVTLFRHGNEDTPNPLSQKSDRTFIREGVYTTTSLSVDETDANGNPTGKIVTKSIADIEVPHPDLPDFVDLYVTMEHGGLFIDAVHEIRFINSLFITADISFPSSDGIDVAEQFATVYRLHPDFPDDLNRRLPVADGTLVKWELIKQRFAKDRPFYSTDILSQQLSGVYSTTISGVARDVFLGPIGNIQNHVVLVDCDDSDSFTCCIGEEYAIKATVILGEQSAVDGMKFTYQCTELAQFSNRRFLMNASENQSLAGGPQSPPHWITWADGIHLLKFQIAKNPALSQINGADCFRNCVENVVGGQLFPLTIDQIVQITAPAEILWDVSFQEDPYTASVTPISFQSISPQISQSLGIPFVANIPIRGETTDFYIRLNSFIGDGGNPRPQDCERPDGGSGGGSSGILACEWKNVCEHDSCIQGGIRWSNVSVVNGTTSLLFNNKEVALLGGGNYENGIPPIYIGFIEPLEVRIIDARVNGHRITELVVDSVSYITFTTEVKFAGEPVPDGTPVELRVLGQNQNIVILSNCIGANGDCVVGSSGTVFTRQVNDPIINPQDESGNVAKRSFVYFTINPLPNVAFNARISVTCRYDKLGTAVREITKCIEVNNTINTDGPSQIPEIDEPVEKSSTSNESIVYDTIQDKYESTRAANIQRSGQFASAVSTGTGEYIYVFGGYTGSTDSSTANISAIGEFFNPTTQEWAFTTDMPTPRAFGMTVAIGNRIYCIGGVEIDPLVSQYVVSRKLDIFNTQTETWDSTKRPLPEQYGVAYGNAQVVGDFIYVTCGVNTISDSSRPDRLNDRILRYSIVDDSWEIIIPSDVFSYKRIAPCGFFRSAALNLSQQKYYVYGGSIPKPRDAIDSERNAIINRLLSDFRSFIFSSTYFSGLTTEEQQDFINTKEQEIVDGVSVPAFIYPATGFTFLPGTETISVDGFTIAISTTLDQEWTILPKPRDHGQCVYIPHQDTAYFIGGSNHNQSTTLNRVESIDLGNDNTYFRLTPLNRGRKMFSAIAVHDDIYLLGGLTSGHKAGFVEIDVQQFPNAVEARGTQSCGLLISLRNDAGEIIDKDIRVAVRGRLRMPEIDNVLADFFANRAADRALGGDGSGNAPDLPDGTDPEDLAEIIKAQNKITDPNSDDFQFNAAKKLGEQVAIFPILYSQTEFTINGIGGVSLLPRSEDPLTDFTKLSEFIKNTIARTPSDPNERFEGDLTRDELISLGEVLSTINLPPTVLDSGALRNLYSIETSITVLDDFYFGQTVSEFDLDIQEEIKSRIEDLLTPDSPQNVPPSPAGGLGVVDSGSVVTETECFLLQHSATPDIPQSSTPPQSSTNNPTGTGGFSQSGQCLFCDTLLPLTPQIRKQLPTLRTDFFNVTDWIPQIRKRVVKTGATIQDVIDEIEIIDHEVPFGGSQLYSALFEAARTISGEAFDDVKKVIYVTSDNSQNLSLVTRRQVIDEINSIDGEKNTPIIYTVFSTSFPVSLASQLERTEVGDVDRLTQETGGQSATLISSTFIDQVLNLTISSATGGLGYGIYKRTIELEELSAITSMSVNFSLPQNTSGFIRFRYSADGFNFSDFGGRTEGSGTFDFTDILAKIIEIEAVLTTGFSLGIESEYDSTPTGIPKLISITFNTSSEREDFIFLNNETVDHTPNQIAAAFDGDISAGSVVEVGAALSTSHEWSDFQSISRPALDESGKTIALNRTTTTQSVVPLETLEYVDGWLFRCPLGPWDPMSSLRLFRTIGQNTTEILSGFSVDARKGQIYFGDRQPQNAKFTVSITDANHLRIGIRLRNRNHLDTIVVRGAGYIYTTNRNVPLALSQIAPKATNVRISPTNPTSNDTIFAFYTYIDINGDPEKSSVLSWFKNGTQLLEIQNKTSWHNKDLTLPHKLQPSDKINFSITPSDGRDFGTTVISPSVIIVPQTPTANNLKIVPLRNEIINDRFDTSSEFVVQYDFFTEDTGTAAIETDTTIQWFVNGVLFKDTTFSSVNDDPYSTPKSIAPGESGNGFTAHVIGNQIYAEVTPRTTQISGTTARTQTITVVNSVPIVKTISIQPAQPSVQSTLILTFEIDDLDIDNNIQTDQSEIKWFSSPNGTNFAEVTDLRNTKTAPPFYLRNGEQWYAEVTPYDGLELGAPVLSSKVTIRSI